MMSSGSGSMPSARITSRMHSLVSAKPSVGPYCSACGRALLGDPGHLRGEALRREGRGVGQAAGERDHLGAGGDLHQVAHRARAHHPGALGEEVGVALEVGGWWCERGGDVVDPRSRSSVSRSRLDRHPRPFDVGVWRRSAGHVRFGGEEAGERDRGGGDAGGAGRRRPPTREALALLRPGAAARARRSSTRRRRPRRSSATAASGRRSPLLVSGASAYRKGEFLYQDYLYDDSGARGTADPSDPAAERHVRPLRTAPTATRRIRAYAENAADLVELRVKPLRRRDRRSGSPSTR